ncbi:DUF1461 domain-containing protein [Candidatus Woesearchaeota archaeon]|nr:DUF1461 domain-containing protein [Candidatus Woesearchaeota archaeon]
MNLFLRAKIPLLTLLLSMTLLLVSFATLAYDLSFWESVQQKNDVNATIAKPLNNAIHEYFFDANYKTTLAHEGLSQKEAEHMRDVKIRINFVVLLALLCSFLSLFALIRVKKEERTIILVSSAIVIWVFPLLFFIIPFDPLFMKFHELFFKSGTFLFDADALLIRVYPQSFFNDFAMAILQRTYLFGLGALVIGFFVKKFK